MATHTIDLQLALPRSLVERITRTDAAITQHGGHVFHAANSTVRIA